MNTSFLGQQAHRHRNASGFGNSFGPTPLFLIFAHHGLFFRHSSIVISIFGQWSYPGCPIDGIVDLVIAAHLLLVLVREKYLHPWQHPSWRDSVDTAPRVHGLRIRGKWSLVWGSREWIVLCVYVTFCDGMEIRANNNAHWRGFGITWNLWKSDEAWYGAWVW